MVRNETGVFSSEVDWYPQTLALSCTGVSRAASSVLQTGVPLVRWMLLKSRGQEQAQAGAAGRERGVFCAGERAA